MSERDTIAFVLYFLSAIGSIAFGVLLLSCKTFLPYHKKAINMAWEELSSGLQILIQSFIKLVAGGFFLVGFAILILLLIPFRQGEHWAHWTIPLLAIVWSAFCLFVTARITVKTHVATTWPVSVLAIIITVIAFVLSPGF